MPLTIALVTLAGLAYLGTSLVMLASVAGMAVALWITHRRPFHQQALGILLGAVGIAFLAEIVHLSYHTIRGDEPDHGGFWLSAFLVGLINALAIIPVAWYVDNRARRTQDPPPSRSEQSRTWVTKQSKDIGNTSQ